MSPYLGVTVSWDLHWEKHINTITAKATRTLNFVRRNVYYCDPDTKALAYLSLVRPLLEYAAAAWDPYRTRDINTLEMVQRRAAHFAKHDYRRTTSVTNLLGKLDWPVLSDRHREACVSLFSKAAGGHSAISLSHLFQPTSQTCRADHTSFIHIAARTDVYKYSFFPCTLLDWNTLSAEVRLKYSLQASQLIWSTKPWHSSSKGWRPLLDICWRTEEHSVWPKTRPGPVKPSQHSLITGPAGLSRQIFALRPKIRPGPLLPNPVIEWHVPLPKFPHSQQRGLWCTDGRWWRVFEMPNS